MLLTFSDCTLLLILPIGFGILFYILSLTFRYPTFRYFTEHQPLEFTWTFLPALSLILLALPSLSLLYTLDEVGFPCSTSKVQGHQWYWVYESADITKISLESYLRTGPVRLLSSDSSLSLCSRVTLRFLVTAADVLHS
jgi:heme/copper-type cytochrome/quinol oxidase subunit 2